MATRSPTRRLTIGEFSKATALTVKTLRHYHERGLLQPAHVDPDTGYRSYDRANLERARVISGLRELEIPLDTIGEILAECSEDEDALEFLRRQRTTIASRLQRLQQIQNSLDHMIGLQSKARNDMNASNAILSKSIESQLIAAIRMHGSFEQCASGFKKLGRSFGFGLAGKPGMLIYDEEYKPGDSEFEVFFPIRQSKAVNDGISVRTLDGGHCLSLVHHGPYDELPRTYGRLFSECAQRGLRPALPSREIYIKGPGMIFRGNPKHYRTEVQIFVEPLERASQ